MIFDNYGLVFPESNFAWIPFSENSWISSKFWDFLPQLQFEFFLQINFMTICRHTKRLISQTTFTISTHTCSTLKNIANYEIFSEKFLWNFLPCNTENNCKKFEQIGLIMQNFHEKYFQKSQSFIFGSIFRKLLHLSILLVKMLYLIYVLEYIFSYGFIDLSNFRVKMSWNPIINYKQNCFSNVSQCFTGSRSGGVGSALLDLCSVAVPAWKNTQTVFFLKIITLFCSCF